MSIPNATTSNLPAETIECEILPRLPVKSLVRFKLVCKSWNSFISLEDSLTLMTMRRSGNNDPDSLESTTIIGCTNGLVLLKDEHPNHGTLRFTIWNPATKQCLKIPRPSNIEDFEGYNNFFSAFGFDSVANDVKIMHVTVVQRRLVGYLYSCNGGCWRRMTPSNFLFRGHIVNYLQPVIVHGSPFWLWYRYCPKNKRWAVISFDVRQESFRLLPNIGGSTDFIPYSPLSNYKLLNFRDSIAIMYCPEKNYSYRGTNWIYVYNERSDDWSKMSIGPFKYLSSKAPIPYLELSFLQCFRNGDILFVDSYGVKDLYYVDLQNRTIKSLGKKEDYCSDNIYTESSFFIDGMKPFYDKENQVQFLFLQKTREGIQKFWHSSASLRAARQDIYNKYLCKRDEEARLVRDTCRIST